MNSIRGNQFNRFEEILLDDDSEGGDLCRFMAHASAYARKTVHATSIDERVQIDIVASVAAPLLSGFVLWALSRAKKLHLDKLYFLSRDGQILKDLADIYTPKMACKAGLDYLYTSRQVWLFPAFGCDGHINFSDLWKWGEGESIRELFSRINLTPDRIEQSLIQINYSREKWDDPLSASELRSLQSLVDTKTVRSVMIKEASRQREVLLDYFQQFGLFSARTIGVVDLMGTGSLHRALSSILGFVNMKPPVGLFFVLDGSPKDESYQYRSAYMYDSHTRNNYLTRILPHAGALLECFCAGDHGTVIGMERTKSRVEPVFSARLNRPVLDWGLPIYRKTITAFGRRLASVASSEVMDVDVRRATSEGLELFWTNPTKPEAKSWGSFPVDDGWGKRSNWYPLAQPYTWSDLKLAVRRGSVPKLQKGTWIAGSLSLTSNHLAYAIRFTAWLSHPCVTVLKRLRRAANILEQLMKWLRRTILFLLFIIRP